MKKFFAIIIASVLAMGAEAQIVSSHSRSIKTVESTNYTRMELSYAPLSVSGDIKEIVKDVNGVRFGFVKGFGVSSSLPLYVEAGINVTYMWGTREEKGYHDIDSKFLNLNIPVNVAYRYALTDNIIIAPYVGLHLRGNIYGTLEEDGEEYNFFDKDDFDDETANRVQFGMQIGVGVEFSCLCLGIGYENQFNEYMKEFKTSGMVATLGIKF